MLKRFLVLSLLTQRNLISSEPEVNENTENTSATRQLNFGDCCPCPGQDGFQDSSANSLMDTITVTDDTSGPCGMTSDSEGASSIFRPAFRAAQPYIRPVSKKGESKPLLNPEVDLASSVLETLQEVTDQEYQEALVRDAARSVLQFMDPELPKPEPRNVVNIIVSSNDDNNGDIMSEATEMQESTCILPSSNTNNNLENLRQQPSTNLLKDILTPPKFSSNDILNRNRFDIDGSASNTQERMTTPLKNNILENLKTRLNLLNLKPFSNTDNRDFLTSPNILQKYYLKNNITDRILSQNIPLIDVKSKSPNNVNENFAKNAVSIKKNHNMDTDEVPDFKKDATASFDNISRKLKMSAGNILQNIVCTETVSEPNLSVKENPEYFEVIPSSSKVIEVKNLDIKENPNIIEQENEADKVLDMDADTNNLIPSTLESETKENSFPKNVEEASEEITEDVVDVQTNNFETENTAGHFKYIKDMESKPSINRNIVTNLPVTVASPEFISTSEDENKIRNAYPITSKDVRDQESLSSTSAERDVVESKIHTLPNIKSDIFKTLESFNKANEKFQEKLRYNVQDALQQVIASEPPHSTSQTVTESYESEIGASSVEQPQNNSNTVPNTSNGKSMSTQDLQNMSDSLLELSSLKDNAKTSTTFVTEELVEELENKPVEFENMSYNDDMITTPTFFNEKNNSINLKNDKLNLNVKDQHLNSKNDKIEENVCSNDIIAKNSEPSIIKNEDNEMTAQPSNSVLNRIYQQDLDPPRLELLQRDFIVQPEDNSRPIKGIKDFFNSFRALSTDRSTNYDSESVFFDNQPLFRSDFGKTIDSSKSFSGNTPKLSSDSNLNSNIAKVASPKSLDFNSLLPTLPYSNDEADVLGFASQKIPHTTNFKNIVRNNLKNGLNPVLKTIEAPKVLQDTFSSITPRLAESFKSHTNNALKTFRDTLDVGRGEPFTINKNNLLGKSLIRPDHLFGTILKTHEDFSDKIQAFHSDLNRRLSSISSRTSPDGSRLLWTPSKLKNKAESYDIASKNTAATLVKTKSPTMKNTQLSKNIPSIETNKKTSTDLATRSNRANILKSNIKEKLGILPHSKDLGSKKAPVAINPPKSILTTKQPLKSNMKLKPLKENKVTISFATTSIRPDVLKSRIKPTLQMDSLRSSSVGDLAKVSKRSKSLEDNRKPTLRTKLKSNDPNVLASEISISRAIIPETISQQASSLEESERLCDGNINYDDDNRCPVDISEANRRKIMLRSKLRRPFATEITSDGTNKNDKMLSSRQKENVLDETQSASNNIDTSISASTFIEERLKSNNQSFKCKMVCIQDILDSTDASYEHK